MSSRRQARLNEQMKREISELLRTEVRDPRIGVPTVTDVEVTPDLWLARVFVRPDPTRSDVKPDALMEGLATAAPYIRRELGKSLRVRRVPELRFEADRVLDQALRIEQILREVLPSEDERETARGSGSQALEPPAAADVDEGEEEGER
jgi:ribosome-binding factor A